MQDQQHILRAAQQNLATDRMFGVDFIPRGTAAGQLPMTDTPSSTVVETQSPAVTSTVQKKVEPKVENVPTKQPAQSPTTSPTVQSPTVQTPKRTTAQKQTALDELRARHDAECPHCTTVTAHTQTVFGEGDPNADLMFVGEAPGAEEDRTGRPFVGRAGSKLDEIITAMGLDRESVFIANVLKSRPPDNRTPLQGEVDLCSPYLVQQIRIIEPKVIVTLGSPATKLMLNTKQGITSLRGIWAQHVDSETGRVTPIMPTFHPAYLLRAYTPENRSKVWSDMQAVMLKLSE